MLFKDFSFRGDSPKYIQIAEYIKIQIESKNIKDKEKLPTIRDLSKELYVNKITVINAYKRLVEEGFAYQKVGAGTFAKRKEIIYSFNKEYQKKLKEADSLDEELIDFTGQIGRDIYFSINKFKLLINEVLERDGEKALILEEPLGYSELRKTIGEKFFNNKEYYENILIVSGAQQGIDIAAKSILNINDNVIVEKYTYGGATSVFKWRKANIFEVEVEEDGINLVKLESILKKNKIKCLYTMPYFNSSTGFTYSKEKKEKLLELAEKYDFYIIEDDYLSEFIYDESIIYKPLKHMDKNERVIYIKSLSKSFMPGIRLGYMVVPKNLIEDMKISKVNTDIATSSLMQRTLDLYIKKGYLKEYVTLKNKRYKENYSLFKELVNLHLKDKINYFDPKGGLYFYLSLNNKKINSEELFYRLIDKKVFITPGTLFYKNSDSGYNLLRICFTKVDKEKLEIGIKIIGEILDGVYNN